MLGGDDSALRALSSLSGLRGAPEVPPLCRERSVYRTANVATVVKKGLKYQIALTEISYTRQKSYRCLFLTRLIRGERFRCL